MRWTSGKKVFDGLRTGSPEISSQESETDFESDRVLSGKFVRILQRRLKAHWTSVPKNFVVFNRIFPEKRDLRGKNERRLDLLISFVVRRIRVSSGCRIVS